MVRRTNDASDQWCFGILNSNLPGQQNKVTGQNKASDDHGRILKNRSICIDMCNILGLEQLIGDYTRVTCRSKTLFDPIYTNVSYKHSYSGIVQTSMSDHYMVYTIVSRPKVVSKGVTKQKKL